MATGDIIDFVRPRDLTPLNGPPGTPQPLVLINEIAGVDLRKLDTQVYAFEMQVPNNGTPLSTGLTFQIGLVGALTDDDPGKVVRIGIQVKKIVSDTDDETNTADATEQFFTQTMNATSGVVEILSCAVANANLDSAAAGSRLMVLVRRNGSNTADTHNGRVVMTGITVKDT